MPMMSGPCYQYHVWGSFSPFLRGLFHPIDLAFGIGTVLLVAQVLSVSGVFPAHLGVEGGDGGGAGQAPHPQAAAVGGHCQVLSQ